MPEVPHPSRIAAARRPVPLALAWFAMALACGVPLPPPADSPPSPRDPAGIAFARRVESWQVIRRRLDTGAESVVATLPHARSVEGLTAAPDGSLAFAVAEADGSAQVLAWPRRPASPWERWSVRRAAARARHGPEWSRRRPKG